MAITASMVKELREKTGLGMMACKKALTETDGDMEKAIENLRKQGQATAAKRAGKAAKEGKVHVIIQENDALIYEVNSETDFVARNDDFLSFVEALGFLLMNKKPSDMDAAKALVAEDFGGQSVESKIMELVGKIGENISFRRFKILPVDKSKQRAFSYVHGNGRIGVVLTISSDKPEVLNSEAVEELGKDLAMQIAASNPLAISRDMVSQELVSKEREIFLTQAQTSGKPEKVWERIVDGKLSKFFKEVALLEQEYIKDTDLSVTDRIKQTEKETNSSLSVDGMIRFELGSEEEE
ncbi:MAG: translation elongation factor Ts [Chitinispirillaceae bacterium]